MALFIAASVTIITLVSVGVFWARAGGLPTAGILDVKFRAAF